MKSNLTNCRVWAVLLVAGVLACGSGRAQADEKITFEDHVQPLLAQRCASCHNPNNKSGDLDVTNFTAMMLGGGSGTVIEAGEPSASYLYKLITHEESPEMPPEGDKLPEAEIDLVRRWIEGGALETKSSKAAIKKKKVAAVAGDATVRPEVVPQPCQLSLEVAAVPHRSPAVMAVATSPWAPLVAVGTPFQVLLFDTQTQQLRGVLPFPEGHIFALRFSRNGSLLLAGGGRAAANGVAIAWDIQTGERVIEIGGLADAVLAADISSDHTRVAVGSTDRLVRIYDSASGKQLHEIKKHTDWVQSLEFSPDGVLLASGDRSGGVLVWEAKTGREYLDLRGHQGAINGLSWRVDSNVLASASQDASIRLWEMENGGQIANWNAHGGGVTSVQFTRDSRVVSGGRDQQAKIFNQSGNQEKAYPLSTIITSVRLCDETNRLLACDLNGQTKLWEVATDAELTPLNLVIPKLEERLAAASTQLQSVQAEWQTRQAARDQVQAQLTQQQSQQQALEGQLAELAKTLTSLTERRQQTMTDLDSQRSQLSVAQDAVNQLGPGLTNLTQAIEAVQRSLATMQSAQLEASLKQLTELKQTNEVQLARHQETAEQLPAKVMQLTEAVATLDKELATAQEAQKSTEPMLVAVQAQIAEAQQQLTQKQTELEQCQPQVDAAQAVYTRLQAAAEFARQESQLLAQLEQQARQIEQVADQVSEMSQKASENEREVVAQSKVIADKQTQVDQWLEQDKVDELALQTLAQQIATQEQSLAQAMSQQTRLQATNERLATAAAALVAALEAAGGTDEAIQALHAQTVALQDSQSKQVEQLMAQQQAWTAEMAEWAKQQAERTAQRQERQGLVASARQEITELTAKLAPVQAASLALNEQVNTGEAQLQQEQDRWQAMRLQLLQLRGVSVASDDANEDASDETGGMP